MTQSERSGFEDLINELRIKSVAGGRKGSSRDGKVRLAYKQIADRLDAILAHQPVAPEGSQKERDALRPCPFCGAAGEVHEADRPDRVHGWEARCESGCVSIPIRGLFVERQGAVDAWNRRYPDEPPAQSSAGWPELKTASDWRKEIMNLCLACWMVEDASGGGEEGKA